MLVTAFDAYFHPRPDYINSSDSSIKCDHKTCKSIRDSSPRSQSGIVSIVCVGCVEEYTQYYEKNKISIFRRYVGRKCYNFVVLQVYTLHAS